MKKLIKFIVSSIVDKPQAVKISETINDNLATFTLSVSPEDMGKIIGREGKVIKAIRTLLRVRAMKEGGGVQLILEEESSRV